MNKSKPKRIKTKTKTNKQTNKQYQVNSQKKYKKIK